MPANSLWSARNSKRYTSFGSAINVITDDPGGFQHPCRRVECNAGSGTMTVKTADGVSDTLVFATGGVKDVILSEISSVSGITDITVYW